MAFLAIGGIGLATGILHGEHDFLLGLRAGDRRAWRSSSLALGAGQLAGALQRRSMRAKLVAAAGAVGEGVDEALRLLKTGDPMIYIGAAGYMLFDVAMLGVCFTAFGHDVPPAGVLLVAYIVGQLGGLIPIPGGIGGVDGGLIGTLVLYGVDPGDAAVAVIAYRGLLLTIPALLGLPALAVLRQRLQTEAHDIAACAPGQSVEVLGRGEVQRGMPVTTAQNEHQLVLVAQAPVLAGLGRADDRVPALRVVRGRVTTGELSQQPMCPQVWHIRRCTHCMPVARHSSQPSMAREPRSSTWSRCAQVGMAQRRLGCIAAIARSAWSASSGPTGSGVAPAARSPSSSSPSARRHSSGSTAG